MPQIQVWINNDDPENVETIVKTLNSAMATNKEKKLKTFMIFVSKSPKDMETQLTAIAEKTNAQDICLAYVPPTHDGISSYKINVDPSVKNTVMVYRNRTVTAKYVNFVADKKGLDALQGSISAMLK